MAYLSMGRCTRLPVIAATIFLLAGSIAVRATTVSPESEYRKAIKVSQDIQPLGENPFGEQISMYSGALSFEQTDVSLQGTGPVLQLARNFTLRGHDEFVTVIPEQAFGDWAINLPRIETLTSNNGTLTSWQTSGTAVPTAQRNQRCTYFNEPPPVSFPGDAGRGPWNPGEWWNGYHLIVPGAGDQELMPRASVNTLAPSMPGKSFPIVTKQQWQVGCLSATSNGEPGEAFYAVAPDGTKYWFDYLVYHAATMLTKPVGTGPGPFTASSATGPDVHPDVPSVNFLARRTAQMLVTRIEDRFGNSLIYHYKAGHLTSIDASDGRQLTLQYDGNLARVSTATLTASGGGSRTWTYGYGGPISTQPHLTEVKLPDGEAWSYDLAGLVDAQLYLTKRNSCYVPAVPDNSTTTFSGSITQPSGLTGTFQVRPMPHGRSYVPRECWGVTGNPAANGYAITPSLWYSLTLVSKRVTGAGLLPQVWSYAYSAPHNSWDVDCASNSPCPTTIYSDVIDPSLRTTRYTFSNRYDYTESLLLRTDVYQGNASSAIVRSQTNHYAPPSTGPWPAYIGSSLQSNKENSGQTEQLFPLNMLTIVQDGSTYTWEAQTFNEFAQVTQTKRSNNIVGQTALTERTAYLNDAPHWMLGLPTSTTNVNFNEVMSRNDYDLGDVTLSARWSFGQKLMSYTFDPQGHLASFTDGNIHTTTLGNYYRGIPRAINYPDNTSESLVVDDFGQIISHTDQAGATTTYNYDPIGRITRISHPTGDEVTWLPTTFAYSFVSTAERGIAGGHWRRSVSTGNHVVVTYFDAMLHPLLSDSYMSGTVNSDITTMAGFDWQGLQTFASYPVNGTPAFSTEAPGTHTTYDALQRPIQAAQDSEQGVLLSKTGYLSGARVQVTDPSNHVTTSSYQVFDQPSTSAITQTQAPEGITQTIARDIYGSPLSITQSGLYNRTEQTSTTKTMVYDIYHRLCRTTEPESGDSLVSYDSANNVRFTASGLAHELGCARDHVPSSAGITYTYDAMNRVRSILPPAGTQSTSYHYTPTGNMDQANSGNSLWSAHYNYRGMLTDETLTIIGQNPLTLGYGHNAYGALDHLIYPDGENVTYAPDAFGRPTQVGSYAQGVAYYPNGAVKQFALANGAGYLTDPNTRQLLSNFTYGTDSGLDISEQLNYDNNANIHTVIDLIDGTRTKQFEYDALNRLKSAAAARDLGGTENYTYDALNNLRVRSTGGYTFDLNYDTSNRLSSLTVGSNTFATYAHDARGNRSSVAASGVTRSYLFDAKNQLTKIQGVASYAYDAAGRRTVKSPANGPSTYSFYNHAGQLLYQSEPGLGKSTNFIYLGTHLIADNESLMLAAPGAVTFGANSNNGSYSVSWGAVTGATSYMLQEQVGGGAWATVYGGAATTTTLSGRAGGSYVYQVRACNGSDCGPWTLSATLGVPPALAVVSVPGGTVKGAYMVSWTAPTSASAYKVQERFNGGAWTTIANSTPSTSITRPGTTSGSYTYQVAAYNNHGTRGWAASSVVTVVATGGVLLPPPTPASISIPASSHGPVTVSWAASLTATSYTLQHANYGITHWSTIYSGGATSRTQNETAGDWTYQVQACNASGCSAFRVSSGGVLVTTPPASAPNLSVPASSTTGNYTASWGTVSAATSYTLQGNNGGGWATLQSSSATSRAFSGKPNGSHSYRVQACNAYGCGPWSGVRTIYVTLAPAAPPSVTAPSYVHGMPYTVSWTASAGSTSFNVRRTNVDTGNATIIANTAATNVGIGAPVSSQTLQYAVQACNSSGCSGFTDAPNTTYTDRKGPPQIVRPSPYQAEGTR